ncbi:MAG: hypothetical protein IJP70_03855 [Bacteroidales bacterium]|nr:hypothetical protein [Bacteroidales bacterium]
MTNTYTYLKRSWFLLLLAVTALCSSDLLIARNTYMRIPIEVKPRPGGSRVPAADLISCYYVSGNLIFSFEENLGTVACKVENLTAGGEYAASFNAAKGNDASIYVSTLPGDYKITLACSSVLYYGDYTIKGGSTGSDYYLLVKPVGTEETSSLQELNPIRYTLIASDSVMGSGTDTMVIRIPQPEQETFGLSRQEVEKVFPELVGVDYYRYLDVNYLGFLPILIKSIKELTDKANTLQAYAEVIGKKKPATDNSSESIDAAPFLSEHTPSVFDADTRLAYFLPDDVGQAVIYIYDMQGAQISAYPLTEKGNAAITIPGGSLHAGIYFYALVADGQLVDTKRMVLTE